MTLPSDLLRQAATLVTDRLGLSFPERRFPDLERGLRRVYEGASVDGLTECVRRLQILPQDHPEWRRMASALTVSETYFFRDPASFEIIEHEVLLPLIASRRAAGTPLLRLWSAGCASGEEAYSLAMLVDRLLPDRAAWSITILATDIDDHALTSARAGLYRPWSVRRTPPGLLERYFIRHRPDCYEVDPRVRAMVSVARLNLATAAYPAPATNTTAMDAILCRNVLMHLTPEVQRAAVARLGQCLRIGGWLAVSPVEASPREMFEPLVPVWCPNVLLFRRRAPGAIAPPPLPVPTRTEAPAPPILLRDAVTRATARPDRPAEAPSLAPGPPPAEQVRVLAERGALDEARTTCEAALERDPLDLDARIRLALVHQQRVDLPAMLEALRGAIYLAPDSAPAHFLMGWGLCAEGRVVEGRHFLEGALELLATAPDDEVLEGWDGLTAGRLRATAQAYGGAR